MQACHFIKDKCPRRAETANALACHLLREVFQGGLAGGERPCHRKPRPLATASSSLHPLWLCLLWFFASCEGWVFNPKIRRLEQHDVCYSTDPQEGCDTLCGSSRRPCTSQSHVLRDHPKEEPPRALCQTESWSYTPGE